MLQISDLTFFEFLKMCSLFINTIIFLNKAHLITGEVLSPTSEPPSIVESMQLMDEILSDSSMDRLDKMERLEALLTAATAATMDELRESRGGCDCNCHDNETGPVLSTEVACQTLSTGDIVITRIFFTEDEKERERTITSSSSSPKKEVNFQ